MWLAVFLIFHLAVCPGMCYTAHNQTGFVSIHTGDKHHHDVDYISKIKKNSKLVAQ